MRILDMKPDEVLQPSRLPEYRKKMRIFWDELVYLHTNLSLLRQIADFDFKLFQAPEALFRYTSRNLMSQCVLIVTRVWGDKRKDVLTLDRFGAWLPGSVKWTYMESVKNLLHSAQPSSKVVVLIDNLRSIRHADVAHLSRDIKLGFKTRPATLNLEEMQEIADCLGDYYNSINFGAEAAFVLMQFHAPSGKYHERQLGYVLDRLALGSKWFRIPEEHPSLWPEYRAKLSSEELEEINAVGRRHRKKPLE
ncbi:MAG: hypothetical protein GY847_06395 [Proteobacteria bacterium]|nr:hypothetical protein [Pseudomonadota bacterium]